MKEFIRIIIVIWHARKIQDFFWNKPGERTDGLGSNSTFEQWIDTIYKRIIRLNLISKNNPSWKVETRKRLIQLAALAIAMVTALNKNKIEPQK